MAAYLSSSNALGGALANKPGAWSHVIALRCALRVVPHALDLSRIGNDRALPRAAIMVFRALAISSGAAKVPLDYRAFAASRAARATRMVPIKLSADSSVCAAVLASARAAYAAFVAEDYAAAAAVGAAGTAREAEAANTGIGTGSTDGAAFWRAVSYDLDALEKGDGVDRLLATPLWRGQGPSWVSELSAHANDWLKRSDDGFSLWHEWYARKLRGEQYEFADLGKEGEREFFIRLFDQNDGWWERKPSKINAEIAQWLTQASNLGVPHVDVDQGPVDGADALKGKYDEPIVAHPSTMGLPYNPDERVRHILQEIASPQAIVADEQIRFRANAEYETPDGNLEAWHPRHLIDLVDVLRTGLSDNAPNPLKVGLCKYHEVLARDPDLPVITTLQACIGVVRATYQSDDYEFWALGLDEPFEALFQGHERLLNDYPKLHERRRLRDQISPTPVARKLEGLNSDIARFADIADQLKELGVTDEAAHAYLQSIVEIGCQVASGPVADASDYVGDDWTPAAQIRADMAGVAARIESQLSLLLSITGHPNVQAALAIIGPEVARLLTFFG